MIYKLLLAVGFISILLIGCSADIETGIIGEWQGLAGHQDLEFQPGGQVVMKSPRHSDYLGLYTITDGNKLTFDFQSLSKPINCTADIRGSKLTLTHPDGRKEEYEKK